MSDTKRVAQEPFIKVTATLRLDEVELRALDRLAQFSHSAVARALQEHVTGSSDIVRAGIESLLGMVRAEVAPILKRTDVARDAFRVKTE